MRLSAPQYTQTVASGLCFTLSLFCFEFLQAAGRHSMVWRGPHCIGSRTWAGERSILTLPGKCNVFWASMSSSVNEGFVLGYYLLQQDLI